MVGCPFRFSGGQPTSSGGEEAGLGLGDLGGEGWFVGGLEYVVFDDGAAVG